MARCPRSASASPRVCERQSLGYDVTADRARTGVRWTVLPCAPVRINARSVACALFLGLRPRPFALVIVLERVCAGVCPGRGFSCRRHLCLCCCSCSPSCPPLRGAVSSPQPWFVPFDGSAIPVTNWFEMTNNYESGLSRAWGAGAEQGSPLGTVGLVRVMRSFGGCCPLDGSRWSTAVGDESPAPGAPSTVFFLKPTQITGSQWPVTARFSGCAVSGAAIGCGGGFVRHSPGYCNRIARD